MTRHVDHPEAASVDYALFRLIPRGFFATMPPAPVPGAMHGQHDPAFAPGVAHREPGGLSTRQVIDLIQSLDQPIVAADIVEFNPRCDIASMTAAVAAKLLKEI